MTFLTFDIFNIFDIFDILNILLESKWLNECVGVELGCQTKLRVAKEVMRLNVTDIVTDIVTDTTGS